MVGEHRKEKVGINIENEIVQKFCGMFLLLSSLYQITEGLKNC